MIKVIKTARTWIYVSFLICNSNFVLADITSDTEKLLNWAESKYPEFFPGHSATQTNIEPWLYRFYPGTGVYAGVNKSDNGTYTLGGPFGNNPVFIDSLSNLISKIPTGNWQGAKPVHRQASQFFDKLEVAISTNGDAVAVWLENDAGTGINSVWGMHYSAATDAWGAPTLLDSGAQSAYEPKVAMDGNGNAVVVWMQQLGVEFNASAAHYRVGSGWEAAVLLENENSAVNGGFQQSSVAMDNAGNAIAVWSQRIGVQSYIYANRYTPGQGWGTAKSIDLPDTPGELDLSFNPKVAINNSGNAVVMWSVSTSSFKVRHYQVSSDTWDSAFTDLGPGITPEIAISDNGNAVVVAPGRANSAELYQVLAWYYKPNTGWGTTGTILDQGRVEQVRSPVRVAMNASGNAVATWSQLDSSGVVSAFANYFENGQWGGPTTAESNNTSEVADEGVEAGIDSSNRAFLVWRQIARDGSSRNNWSSIKQSGSNNWNASSLEPEPLIPRSLTLPRLAVSSTGKAITAWFHHDETNGTGNYLVTNLFK